MCDRLSHCEYIQESVTANVTKQDGLQASLGCEDPPSKQVRLFGRDKAPKKSKFLLSVFENFSRQGGARPAYTSVKITLMIRDSAATW